MYVKNIWFVETKSKDLPEVINTFKLFWNKKISSTLHEIYNSHGCKNIISLILDSIINYVF